ncbi:MAG: hypothetical protein IKH12_09310, partial [Clostridia bacterium]|nr:hypothetical protein [Clostridia bacterium]
DAGLALDSARTEYRASSQDRGVIIGHESLGEKVAPGTKIAVYVSTGNMPTQPTESTSETTSGTTEKPTESTTSSTEPTTSGTTQPTTQPTTAPTTVAPPTTTEPTTTDGPVMEFD